MIARLLVVLILAGVDVRVAHDGPSGRPTLGDRGPSSAGVTVTPSAGGRVDFHADSGQYVTLFVVKNTQASGAEDFTFFCDPFGSVVCASVSPVNFHLLAGQEVTVQAFFNALSIGGSANQAATVRLTAEGNNNGFGLGNRSITLWQKLPNIFTVTPTLATLPTTPLSASSGVATFQVRNVGTTTETMLPGCVVSPAVQCASHSLTGAILAPFAPASPDAVTFTTSFTSAGQFVEDRIITGSGFAVAGRYTFDVVTNPAIQVTAAPDGGAPLTRLANLHHTVPFTVTNSGTQASDYEIRVTGCTGSAFQAGCILETPVGGLTGSLNPGSGASATVGFNTLAAGTSGTITIRAQHRGDTTIFDTGFSTVNVLGPSAVLVTAVPPARTDTVSRTRTTLFRVRNTGSATASYTLSILCAPGALLFSCSTSPATLLNAAPGVDHDVTATFTLGATAGAGQIQVTATDQSAGTVTGNAITTVTVVSPVGVLVTAVPPSRTDTVSRTRTTVFRVRNTAGAPASYTLSILCAPAALLFSCSTSPAALLNAAPGVDQDVTATFTTGATAGAGQITVTATDQSAGTVTGNAITTVSVVAPGVIALAVTPDGVARNIAGTRPDTSIFTVKNVGGVAGLVSFTATCPSTLFTATCQPHLTQQTIPPNDSVFIRVPLTTAALGIGLDTGTVRLVATSGSATDNGTVKYTRVNAVALVATTDSTHTGVTVARDACLALALPSDATSECGHLRLWHPLPSTRTLTKARVPTMTYSSALAHPFPTMPMDVRLPTGAAVPDSVELGTRINGVMRRTARFLGADLLAGVGRRLVAGYDASADTTGIYSYSLELTSFYGTSRLNAVALTGTLAVVNRGASAYGAGWWLSGLEMLLVQTDSSRLWVGGDGSTRRFARVAAQTYVAPALDFPDTLRWDPVNAWYQRTDRGGLRVRYNAPGNHIATVNRLGHTTTFSYVATGSNPRLDRVTLPVPAGGPSLQYVFNYSGANRLLNVAAPSIGAVARPTVFAITGSNQLTTITDPDTSAVLFGYHPTFFRRVASRTDRRSVITNFSFDSVHQVAAGVLTMEVPKPPISIAIVSLAIQGFGVLTSGLNRMGDTSQVRVLHDGPRPSSDVGDTTRFFLDRFGAPKRIVDALGNATRFTRGDSRFPLLVTATLRPNGHQLLATYDARGNLTTRSDVGGNNAGVTDVTTFAWHQTWDVLTSVKTPNDSLVTFGVDAANGNRTLQQYLTPGMRFDFTYHPSTGLMATTKSPVKPRADSMYYSTLGNLSKTVTPKGYVQTLFEDAIGRDTLMTAPIDTAGPLRRTSTRSVYDIVDQLRSTMTIGPAMGYTLVSAPTSPRPVEAETVTVVRTYNREGGVLAIQTLPSGDSVDLNIQESFTYDFAGRQLTRQRGSGPVSTTYDDAGNATVERYRGGFDVTSRYDALNRRTRRIVPGRSYAQTPCSVFAPGPLSGAGPCLMQFPYYPNNGTGLLLPVDTSVFVYDAVGNLTQADNADARVRRGYTLNGAVRVDTQAIRSYTSPTFTSTVFVTRYGYDRNGRRLWMRVPSAFATPDSVAYKYTTTGQLQLVTDGGGRLYSQAYDLGRRPTRLLMGAAGTFFMRDSTFFDDDDRLRAQVRRVPTGVVSSNDLAYDARGKLLSVRRFTRVQAVGTEHLDFAYSGLGTLVAQDRRFNALTSWQVEEHRSEPLGHTYWSQTQSSADGPQLPQRSLFALSTGALTSRTAAFPTSGVTAQTLYPDEVTTSVDATGAVVSTSEVQRNLNSGAYPKYAATRTYYSADGQTKVVQRYQVNGSSPSGAFEEYRHDALGRRVLLRTRQSASPPSAGLAALCVGTGCVSAISRWVWDGAQLLGETRAPGGDGVSAGQLDALIGPAPSYGTVGYVHLAGWDSPVALMNGRVLNPNWRGVPESSQLVDGTEADCSWGTVAPPTCLTVAWGTDVGAYFRRAVPGPGPSAVIPTWLGSLSVNGATGSGRLHRRYREYDPATGQFTQEDPIGLAGGINLFGFGNGDPVNFSDPFGLWPCCLHSAALAHLSAQAIAGAAQAAEADRIRMGMLETIRGMLIGDAMGRIAGGLAAGGSSGRAQGTRYMSAGEATTVGRTGSIPATNRAGQPRVIHYTADNPMQSGQAAFERYNLPGVPTHACRFPMCNVMDDVAPMGTVAPGATQAATSQPINGAARPRPLKP